MILTAIVPLSVLFIELVNPGQRFKKYIWTITLWFFAFFLAFSYGSRCVGCVNYDDFNNVYKFQGQYLSEIGFTGFFERSIAVTHEYVFYFIFWIIANIFQPEYWLFGLSFVTISFLIFSLRGYISDHLIIVLVGLSSIGLSTQLVRQYMAWSILLYIFLQLNKRKDKWLFYLGSIFVHTSSFVLLVKLISSRFKPFIIFIISLCLFLVIFYFRDLFFNLDFEQIKFLTSISLDADILDYNKLFLNRIIVLSVLLFLMPKFRSFILLSILIFTVTYKLPLLPVRLNLIVLSHAYGLLSVYILSRFNKNIQLIGVFLIFSLISIRLIFFSNYNNGFQLWESYSMIF
jgi:hypothetical protein